jgi:hypothetical protein
MQDLESSATHTTCPCCARLSIGKRATPQAAQPQGMGKLVEWYVSQVYVCELSRELPTAVGPLVGLASSHAGKPSDRSR